MLDGNFLTGDLLVSPGEVSADIVPYDPTFSYTNPSNRASRFYSYALPRLVGDGGNNVQLGRTVEWRDEANAAAVVASDRLISPSGHPL